MRKNLLELGLFISLLLAWGAGSTVAMGQAAGFVWANDPRSDDYTPNAYYSYNSSGGQIGIHRVGVGSYTVRFAGLGGNGKVGGSVQVTAYGGGSEYCKVVNWDSGKADFVVNVRCFAASGAPTDSLYCATVFLPPVKVATTPPEATHVEAARSISAKGAVQIKQPNGTIKEYTRGGVTIIFPDGRTPQSFVYATQARAPIPPSQPDDAETKWLADQAAQLMGIIEQLVGNDATAINNYKNSEDASASWYQKITKRGETITLLVAP